MRKNIQEKIHGSYLIPRDVKDDLNNFSTYSRKSESEVIELALKAYFKSDRAFADLRAVEKSKLEWLESFCEHESDYRNFIGNRDLLIRRGSK